MSLFFVNFLEATASEFIQYSYPFIFVLFFNLNIIIINFKIEIQDST